MSKSKRPADVLVIGGGPAGLMAALRAAETGARTVLLEKMAEPGKKLLATGGGRCNLTTAKSNADLIRGFGTGMRFVGHVFRQFSNADVIAFFEARGVPLKTERGDRVFPKSERSQDVLRALLKSADDAGVRTVTGARVGGIVRTGDTFMIESAGGNFAAKRIVIATGGMSMQRTGSTGDGYALARALGHRIVAPLPGLVGLKVGEGWVRRLAGLSLKNVEISALDGARKKFSQTGEMLFTHTGISGPAVLTLSNDVVPWLSERKIVVLQLDLKPDLDHGAIDARLRKDFAANPRRMLKTVLEGILPGKLGGELLAGCMINAAKPCCAVTREERKTIRLLLKELHFTVTGPEDIETAIVTLGGIDLREVDPRTMKSRIDGNVSFAGEVLNLQGWTGGYNLTMCFATGHVAGLRALE